MKESETTPEGVVASEAATVVPIIENPVKYEPVKIRSFLAKVFHTIPEGEIFTQLSTTAPKGYGDTPGKLIRDSLAKNTAPMKGYFLTSTVARTNTQLRALKAAFVAQHVLVLDDVGTKIPWENIPEVLEETYDIESSKNNHQLGIVWEKPITCYHEAQMLIDFAVDAGITDAGGAMPCKKVRLPCGVNGKKGEAGRFHVRLKHFNGKLWTPQKFLDAIDAGVDWEEVRLNAKDRAKRAKRIGTAAWNDEIYYVDPHTGIVDPIVDWLLANNMLVSDAAGSDFFDIVCPMWSEHTEKHKEASLAGYSPLGHGMYPNRRVFHCFHGHGGEFKTREFLDKVHQMAGPECPVEEFAPKDMVNFIYDEEGDRVYDLRQRGPLMPLKVEALNRTFRKVPMPNGKLAAPLPVWIHQKACLKVRGSTFLASTPDKFVTDDFGNRKVNRFFMPEYQNVVPDMRRVQPFLDFIEFLIPSEEERAYFMQWLSCKALNPAFRGAAMIMIAGSEGTGRGMLMELLGKIFGGWNTQGMSMAELMSDNTFNDWATRLFVNVDEMVHDPRTKRKHYNALKLLVDPKTKQVRINHKNQQPFIAECPTSFLFFSNNDDALQIDQGSRRFYAIRNPHTPAPGEFYETTGKYRDSSGWQVHVWSYLRRLNGVEHEMMKAPIQSQAMDDMIHATTSNLDAVLDAAMKVWPTAIVDSGIIKELLPAYELRGVSESARYAAKGLMMDRVISLNGVPGFNDKINHRRVQLKKTCASLIQDRSLLRDVRGSTTVFLAEFDPVEFKNKVDAQLLEDGFDF